MKRACRNQCGSQEAENMGTSNRQMKVRGAKGKSFEGFFSHMQKWDIHNLALKLHVEYVVLFQFVLHPQFLGSKRPTLHLTHPSPKSS